MQTHSFQVVNHNVTNTRKVLKVIREELAHMDRHYGTTSEERRHKSRQAYSFTISDTKGQLSFCRFRGDNGELHLSIGTDVNSNRYLASLVASAMIEHRLQSDVGLLDWGRKVESSGGETLQGSLPLTYT